MKKIYILITFILLTSCLTPKRVGDEIEHADFRRKIESYMDKYPVITNSCKSKPYYKVFFMKDESELGFWLASHLGQPGLVTPIHPDSISPTNPIEIKGIIFFNKRPLVIYDFKNSDGYGLYKPIKISLNKIKRKKSIPDGCGIV